MPEGKEIQTFDVEVFPDSGHHFIFVPLSSRHSKITKLKKACLQDKLPWTQLPTHPWIRYRPGRQDNEAGVHVAIESNLGTVKRGTIYEPRAEVMLESRPEVDNQSTPYAYEGVMKMPVDQDTEEVLLTITNPEARGEQLEIAKLQVIWKDPAGEARNVDLIVDFGNTRTAVLALENIKAKGGKLSSICRPIYFVNRGTDYQDTDDHKGGSDAIIDSWFVLHETAFSQMDPPSARFQPTCEYEVEQEVTKKMMGRTKTEENFFVTKRVPQMFVQLSPTIMGNQARDILAGIDLQRGGNFSLSSPKRYIWDDSRVGQGGSGTNWMMRYNRWNPEAKTKKRLPSFQGPLCRYLYSDGRAWEDINDAPHEKENISDRPHVKPEKSDYPRKDAVTWSALTILETAYRQITSEAFRKGNEEYLPRKLANVHVTYPAGWIQDEIDLYQRAWEKAINIWTVSNKENRAPVSEGGDRPGLEIKLDEAVASQLPLVYSEMLKLRSIGENWIELYGRGKGDDARVRLMTVDIGGGTMDISIVEYRDEQEGEGVLLVYNTLFKDCNSCAGDTLVNEIIGQVLLPAIGKKIEDEGERETFEDVFSGRGDAKAADLEKWSRIIKLVFLPIVRQWLSDLTNNTFGNPEENGRPWKPNEIEGSEGSLIDLGAVGDFNAFLSKEGFGEELLKVDEPLRYERDALKSCITETFTSGLSPLAKYVTAFEVDLVSLSGKPSELPQVKELLDELLPLLPERIIRIKNYEAGPWYPMGKAGTISDAKTVTAVGAALYRAISQGNINNWGIEEDKDKSAQQQFNRNAWGICPQANRSTGFGSKEKLPFLERDAQTSEPVKMLLNGYIGRMKFNSKRARPEQQYQLVWRNSEEFEKKFPGNPQVEVSFERCDIAEDGNDRGIKLADGPVTVKGEEMPSDVLELKLCTLEGGSFWMESAEFDVVWND